MKQIAGAVLLLPKGHHKAVQSLLYCFFPYSYVHCSEQRTEEHCFIVRVCNHKQCPRFLLTASNVQTVPIGVCVCAGVRVVWGMK